ATAMHPKIGQIIDQLYLAGATYASLTGSGSAVFALSEKPLSVSPLVRDFVVYTWAL
ncbi:MAG: 4-(cytidine 5'-diphospho)-2-C-methyl-D-erythritol kinase, partial [Bacteroidetes bacterium]|nr:4-(cytidine 5'-diphospho)-2-C-methyl-D-erythritol kinase [Bacteroidota bacterium]